MKSHQFLNKQMLFESERKCCSITAAIFLNNIYNTPQHDFSIEKLYIFYDISNCLRAKIHDISNRFCSTPYEKIVR